MEGSGCFTWRNINGALKSPGDGHPNDKGAVTQGEVLKIKTIDMNHLH